MKEKREKWKQEKSKWKDRVERLEVKVEALQEENGRLVVGETRLRSDYERLISNSNSDHSKMIRLQNGILFQILI